MTKLATVLRESFEMLWNKPTLFVPRLFSTSISSLIFIGWGLDIVSQIQMLYFFPIILLLGGFVPVMVSSMVKIDGDNVLRKGFIEATKLWKQILGLIGLTLLVAFINAIPMTFGIAAFISTNNIIYLILGGSISLLILLSAGFGLYFIPITILENKRFLDSLREGVSTSKNNSKEVVLLSIFSVIIFGATLRLQSGSPQNVGFTLFFLGRLTSAIVGTYLLVISPQYYLSQEEMIE